MKKHKLLAAMLAGLLLASPAKAWETSDETDRITGERTVIAYQEAISTKISPQRRPTKREPPAVLMIRCTAGKLSVLIIVRGELIAGRGGNAVTYRLDEDKPVASQWSPSTDNTAIGLWETGRARAFLQSARTKKRLLFRTVHEVFGTTEAEFDFGDMSEMNPVLSACKLPTFPATLSAQPPKPRAPGEMPMWKCPDGSLHVRLRSPATGCVEQ